MMAWRLRSILLWALVAVGTVHVQGEVCSNGEDCVTDGIADSLTQISTDPFFLGRSLQQAGIYPALRDFQKYTQETALELL